MNHSTIVNYIQMGLGLGTTYASSLLYTDVNPFVNRTAKIIKITTNLLYSITSTAGLPVATPPAIRFSLSKQSAGVDLSYTTSNLKSNLHICMGISNIATTNFFTALEGIYATDFKTFDACGGVYEVLGINDRLWFNIAYEGSGLPADLVINTKVYINLDWEE